MTDANCVDMRVDGAIATITLQRPQTLNAMNSDLMQRLGDALRSVHDHRAIRAVVLTGAGRGFCSGADLVQSSSGSSDSGNPMDDVFNPALEALNQCPVPTIARINGVAAGGGLGLALACDITIATHSAFFVATFGPRLGIVPDMGATWTLPRAVGRARALGLAMLGERLSAEQAATWGLIWKAVPDDEFDQEVNRVAQALARTSADAMVRIRQSIDAAVDHSFSEQLALEMEHQAVLIPQNMAEGAKAFVEKRDPEFPGR